MKKFILVLVALLLVSWVTYGQSCQNSGNDRVIKGKDSNDADGAEIIVKGANDVWGGSIILTPGIGMASSGNVGIGTASPGKKLEVNGDIKIPLNKYIYFGNSAIKAYNGTYGGLQFYGDQGPCITMEGGGNVGIGTTSPSCKLEVYDGPLTINEPDGNPEIRLSENGTPQYTFQYKPANDYFTISEYGVADHFVIKDGGNVGIGTTSPSGKLNVNGNIRVGLLTDDDGGTPGYGDPLYFSGGDDWSNLGWGDFDSDNSDPLWMARYNLNYDYSELRVNIGDNTQAEDAFVVGYTNGTYYPLFKVQMNGRVGIGTPNPQSELAVNGTITAKKVKVTLDGWPDFVFADNYKPMPINKLEKYIKINRSLPGIPEEKEVAKEGLNLGEINAKLLQKVEELTLYVIEQNKQISELQKKIAMLEAKK
jgi:hypothetical protein